MPAPVRTSAASQAASSRLSRVVREFLETEAAGGAVLIVAAVVALAWANSPLGDSYDDLWHTELAIHVGSFSIAEDLRHWVNDALMALFFFVVGVEVKRELVVGELSTPRRAALPVMAAVGGMVVPGLVYFVVNVGSPGERGWGVPMATDIAFAVGVLAVLGPRIPSGLKVFLLSLAIADDIGAIGVIALVYSDDVRLVPLAWAAAGVAAILALRLLHRRRTSLVLVAGSAVWLAVFESGLHATLAGVVLGLLVPARTRRGGVSPAERLEHQLHPATSFFVLPLFALANAGVRLDGDALDAPGSGLVAAGVVLGLVVGKTAGVALAARVAVAVGAGDLPDGVSWRHITGAGALAGIGFTVSLFVSELAFESDELRAAAKLGVLAASVVASVIGAVVLLAVTRSSVGQPEVADPETGPPLPAS